MQLQQYDFTVNHRKGKNMEIADGLSRAIETVDITIPDDWYEGFSQKIIKDPEKYPDFRLEGSRILKFCKKKSDLVDSEFVWKLVVPRSNIQKVLCPPWCSKNIRQDSTAVLLSSSAKRRVVVDSIYVRKIKKLMGRAGRSSCMIFLAVLKPLSMFLMKF
jgi:hypothetical protein